MNAAIVAPVGFPQETIDGIIEIASLPFPLAVRPQLYDSGLRYSSALGSIEVDPCLSLSSSFLDANAVAAWAADSISTSSDHLLVILASCPYYLGKRIRSAGSRQSSSDFVFNGTYVPSLHTLVAAVHPSLPFHASKVVSHELAHAAYAQSAGDMTDENFQIRVGHSDGSELPRGHCNNYLPSAQRCLMNTHGIFRQHLEELAHGFCPPCYQRLESTASPLSS